MVADRIEAYLAEHPDAADTLAGICNWWLSGVPAFAVQKALDDLVTRGMVRRQDVPGGAAVYSRGPGGRAARPPSTSDT